jgi:hypothetical protein
MVEELGRLVCNANRFRNERRLQRIAAVLGLNGLGNLQRIF